MNKFSLENRRYTGSKAKLSDWILELINQECKGNTFLDIFAGTGIVSAKASKYFKDIILNDTLHSNNVIYNAFFYPKEYDKNKIYKIIYKYNSLNAQKLDENFFSKNFGGRYFSNNTAKIIGFIREDIEKRKKYLTKKEYAILLTSLIYAIDKIANTVGHYDAYIRKTPKDMKVKMKLIKPINVKKLKIFREDANTIAKNIKADVVYIDPPYNSRQYSRFYHVLETLTKWDKPKLYGVALKPEPENMSGYCKVNAPTLFKDLIDNLDTNYIVVSYNNTYNSKSNSSRNKIELEEIKRILKKRGKTKIFKKSHRFFNAGNTEFNNHQEFIFITEVN